MLGLGKLKLKKSFLTCLTYSLLSALGAAYDEVLTQTADVIKNEVLTVVFRQVVLPIWGIEGGDWF